MVIMLKLGWRFDIAYSLPFTTWKLYVAYHLDYANLIVTGDFKLIACLGGSVSWSIVLYTKKVSGLIPGKEHMEKQPIDVCLSHWCFSLKSINIALGED